MRGRLLAAAAVLAVGFTAAARPALVVGEDSSRRILLWHGQSGEIRFLHSVTDRPVTIRFRLGRRFEAFSVATDPLTESTYTAGVYLWNDRVGEEQTELLRLCSLRGIDLRLGSHELHIAGGCLEVRLLWTL
ncbi:MAG: hypothetical protein WHT06_12820 [Desulfobacterales bacterium]